MLSFYEIKHIIVAIIIIIISIYYFISSRLLITIFVSTKRIVCSLIMTKFCFIRAIDLQEQLEEALTLFSSDVENYQTVKALKVKVVLIVLIYTT